MLGSTSAPDVAYAGTYPNSASMRSRRWRYCGSRSFQWVSTGEAMKIDE